MSTIKSSAENLTLNADGSGNDIIFQSNGSNVATLDQAGLLTATTFAGSGASLTALNATNLASGTVPTARLGTGTANSSVHLRGDGAWAAAGGGKVLQVVYDTAGGTDLTATTSESDVGLSVNITPQTGSYLLLLARCHSHLVNSYGATWFAYWFMDSSNIGQAFKVAYTTSHDNSPPPPTIKSHF